MRAQTKVSTTKRVLNMPKASEQNKRLLGVLNLSVWFLGL